MADPRHRRGKRHPFVSVLLIACSAVLAGARSFAAIGQWARNAPQEALTRLGPRTTSVFAIRVAPSTATVRRIIRSGTRSWVPPRPHSRGSWTVGLSCRGFARTLTEGSRSGPGRSGRRSVVSVKGFPGALTECRVVRCSRRWL
ncbi:transposase family protein [Streptomyces sp. NPDC058316]|uniref:transposase family protein n=1 Tax=unclassified Streptomyces TaxID=2593676 RepID=UPI0036EBC404